MYKHSLSESDASDGLGLTAIAKPFFIEGLVVGDVYTYALTSTVYRCMIQKTDDDDKDRHRMFSCYSHLSHTLPSCLQSYDTYVLASIHCIPVRTMAKECVVC